MLKTNFFIVHSKRHHNIHALKNVETLEGQATLLGKTNSGIQIAKLIQWFCLNFQQQNNRIGCRGNLLPESQFYCQYFAARLSFISRMQTSPPSSPRKKFGKQYVFPSIGFKRHEDKGIDTFVFRINTIASIVWQRSWWIDRRSLGVLIGLECDQVTPL